MALGDGTRRASRPDGEQYDDHGPAADDRRSNHGRSV
jgi:hypothetical protein